MAATDSYRFFFCAKKGEFDDVGNVKSRIIGKILTRKIEIKCSASHFMEKNVSEKSGMTEKGKRNIFHEMRRKKNY